MAIYTQNRTKILALRVSRLGVNIASTSDVDGAPDAIPDYANRDSETNQDY